MTDRAQVIIRTEADRRKVAVCKVPECSEPSSWKDKGAYGYCSRHYYRWKRHGDPLAGRTQPGQPMAYLSDNLSNLEAIATDDCLIWPYARNSAGYGHLSVDGKNKLVHRLACEAAHGEPTEEKNVAAHSCGNGHLGCFNPHHLRWDTYAGNSQDMSAHGNSQRGERTHMAKLTEQDVLEIRASGLSFNELADQYGVTRSNISHIINRKSWRHV
jgi:DNA-binding CsgD family transcriptional regulator